MKQKIILHLDMNSYFASVEQQANPFLRGKSVGVCAYLSPRGTIIASSVEAKAKGIRTACRVEDAKLLDPAVVLVENEPAKYRTVTARIFSILAEYSDNMEPYSIDEAFVDIGCAAATFEDASRIAEEIRRRILDEVGEWLRCSIGISYTKFLAKFAGDTAPKGGTRVITPETLPNFLDCPVTEAWGIARGFERRLAALGIRTLNELRRADASLLKRRLGWHGYYLWSNVNGIELSLVGKDSAPPKSIGHSYCLPRAASDPATTEKIIYKLCEKTGRRLRSRGFEAGHCSFYCSLIGGGHLGRSITLSESLFTTEEIFDCVMGLYREAGIESPIRMAAMSVSRLSPVSGQLSLFYDKTAKRSVSAALDRINEKYGEYTVCRGAMFGIDSFARDRIGFRKTVSFSDQV